MSLSRARKGGCFLLSLIQGCSFILLNTAVDYSSFFAYNGKEKKNYPQEQGLEYHARPV